ncbi:MAG: hypothetical protein FJ035_01190 [Chloroflexi bacterium]|nr:hypothetical protein [Chloroflexota bacterium]
MTVPAGIIAMWPGTNASIPAGWSRVTSLDGRYVKGAAAGQDPDQTGGAATHTHTDPGHSHGLGSHTHGGTTSGAESDTTAVVASGYTASANPHTHTAPTSGAQSASSSANAGTWNTASNDPPYRTVIFIQSDGAPDGFPDGGWAYWDNGAGLPANWSLVAAAQGKFLKGANAGGDGGSTGGGAHSHTAIAHGHSSIASHTHAGGTSSGPSATSPINSGGGAATSTHTHAVTFGATASGVSIGSATAADTSSDTYEPTWTKLAAIQNNSGDDDLQARHIGLWLGLLTAIPPGWLLCNGSNGTLDMRGRFPKGVSALGEIAATGGSGGHAHTSGGAHTHAQSHVHAQSFAAENTNGGGTASSPNHVANWHHTHADSNSAANATALDSGNQTAPSSADTQPPFRTVAFLRFDRALVVTLDAPAESEVLTSPTFLVEWSLAFNPPSSAPVQSDYRVVVYAADQMTVVYDSGQIASATQSHAVSGSYVVNNQTYYLQVEVTDEDQLFAISPLREVTTSWPPPATITGLTVTPVSSLPGLLVSWDAAEPTIDEAFVQYSVKRRRAAYTDAFGRAIAATTYVRIAVLDDIDGTVFTDHHTGSGVEHEYAVTWTANVSGDVLESEEQEPPVAGTVSWSGGYLHDPADPSVYTAVLVREAGVEQQQEQTTLRARGRREDTLFVGEGFQRAYEVTPANDPIRDRGAWDRLRAMLDRQFSGASYCLRIAYSGEVVFGRLESLRVQDRTALTQPAFKFSETHYEEAV